MKRVILTGATGFIGRWFVKELLQNNIKVTALVRDKKKIPSEYIDNKLFDYVEGDISELSASDFTGNYDYFYHLAWEGVDSDKKNNIDLQLSNIRLALSTIELAAEIGVEKYIATGTVAEYVFSKDILDLDARQTPNDMYGAAKTSAHYFLEVRARQLNINFIWAILPSTFGEYRNDNNIITYTIRTLLKGGTPEYGDLNQMWDFLYVSDVVKALLLIGLNGTSNKTYGIGSGIYRPLKEYIIIIRNEINSNLEIKIGAKPELSNQTFSSCVNIIDLCRDTGFRPMVSFEEGIKNTIAYWETNL